MKTPKNKEHIASDDRRHSALCCSTVPAPGFYDFSTGNLTILGGAIALAVNASGDPLYVAGVKGTVCVFARNPAAAPPAIGADGVIQKAQGTPTAGVTVTAAGQAGKATAVGDSTGLFVPGGLPLGKYTGTPVSAASSFSPASRTVSVIAQNMGGLTFQANPPAVPNRYAMNSRPMTGAGVATTATVTLNQPDPAGGTALNLSTGDAKPARFPAPVTVPAGQCSVSFQVRGNGASTTPAITMIAKDTGETASTSLMVAPGDKGNIAPGNLGAKTGQRRNSYSIER